ncbi:hypothetical protein [Streptomyces sp. NPDC001980]|uniref:hypothetical protein n=1 Tax=Streptomyces sp. NPDC001980 TaxID=3157126 RepID=UPI003322CB8C
MQPVAGGLQPSFPRNRSAGGREPSAVKRVQWSTITSRSPSGSGSLSLAVAAPR